MTESKPIARFLEARAWTPVLGTHMSPLRFFGTLEERCDPNHFIEVIHIIDCGVCDVAVTRGGALLARVHGPSSEKETLRVATMFNAVLCELALNGIPSQPVADTDVGAGKLIDGHAFIQSGNVERTLGPFSILVSVARDVGTPLGVARNDWWAGNFYWTLAAPAALHDVKDIGRANALAVCGDTIPGLVAAAASHAGEHNFAETILASWIVCEAIVSKRWRDMVENIDRDRPALATKAPKSADERIEHFLAEQKISNDKRRRKRMTDHRTYTAAVQLEFLLSTGELDRERYEAMHVARTVRNDLAHGAEISQEGAHAAFIAMKHAISWMGIDSQKLEPPLRTGSGIGGPDTALEPAFRFR